MISRLTLLIGISNALLYKWVTYISTDINYNGMDPASSGWRWLVALSGILLTSVVISALKGKCFWVNFTFWFFFVLPNGLTYALYEVDPLIFLSGVFCSVLISGALLYANNIEGAIAPPLGAARNGSKFSRAVTYMLACFVLSFLYFFATHGFNINYGAIFLSDIYEWRWEVTGARSTLENYLFSWSTKVFLFVGLIYAIHSRNYKLLAIIAFCSLYLFSTSGQKSIIFWSLLVAVFTIAQQSSLPPLLYRWLAVLFAAAVILLSPVSSIFDDLIVRRMLFLPTYLNHAYLEAFPQPLFLSHSVLNGVFSTYQLDQPPAYIIGWQYWGFHVSLNNGVISDGFVNFGWLGALAFPVAALASSIFVALRLKGPYYLTTIPYIWQFNNSALITTYFSHGFLFLVILAALMRKTSQRNFGAQ